MRYWIDPARPPPNLLGDQLDPNRDYNVISQDAILHVNAPESVILIGAAIGGTIAFILLPGVRNRSDDSTTVAKDSSRLSWVAGFFGLLGAITLSIIVTILLSRMSEGQTLIRITASDLWGAIAVGFVANYLGNSILRNILPPLPGESAGERKADEPERQGKRDEPPLRDS